MFIPKIPNNSLTNEINQIVELAKALHETRRFVFNPSASKNEIEKWEENNGIKLPQTYIDWLEFSNGSVLRGTVAEIYGLDKIIVKSEYFPEGHIIIGSLTGDGELICFSKETGEIFINDHDDIIDYDDFNELLEEIIGDINGMW